MAKKPTNGTTTQSTDILPWEDPGANAVATEADNQMVAEMLAGFKNLEGIRSAGGLPFLGLDKGGNWKYGQDATEPEPGAYWAVDTKTAQHGWIAWVDGKVAGERMVSIGEERHARTSLDAGLPWQDQVGVELVCVSGEDKGTKVLFKHSSVGGVKAFMSWKDAAKRAIPNDPAKPIAIVQLETTSYTNKYGKITNPVLKICGWASQAILQGQATPDDVKPAAQRAPRPEPEVAAAGNRRRRVGG
jgi:hypothetical protein